MINATDYHCADSFLSRFFEMGEDGQEDFSPYIIKILDALGWSGDIEALRDALPSVSKRDAMGMTEFLNVMAVLGFSPKVMTLNASQIPHDSYPCLFVPFGRNAKGRVLSAGVDCNERGRVFIFSYDDTESDINPDKTVSGAQVPWFSKLLYRFKAVFIQVFIASLFVNLLALVLPVFMMSVYDKVIGAHSVETLKYLLFGVVLALGGEFCLRYLRSKSLAWFSARMDYIVSSAILSKIMALPASYTEKASVAAQLSRLKAFESVREFFTSSTYLSFIELPFTIILLLAIYVIGGWLVLVPLFVACFYFLLVMTMKGQLAALTMRMSNANGERQKMHVETLNKQEALRFAGAYSSWMRRYEVISAESSYASYLYNQAIAKIDVMSQGAVIVGGVAMIYLGVERIIEHEISMGAMIALLILTWRTLAPLQMACTAMPRLEQVKRNIHQINKLMGLPAERDVYRVGSSAAKFSGDVEFHNVGLRYSKNVDPIYAGLSFKTKSGQMVAIVGANSTGKSTTLKLVSGLYHPQAGSVRIDGTDIRQIDPIKLRQNISYVGQNPEFFSMTLEENLRLVCPDASFEEMGAALNKAGLSEWVRLLPDSLSTKLGYGGVDVPSVFRTQLALARAYIQDSAILLIDELPFEFLNSSAGKDFTKYLKQERGRRTIFYVSYRQDHIDLADISINLYSDERPQIKEIKRGKKR